MYYAQPSDSFVWAVVSDYTLASETPAETAREALEEQFVLDFLVLETIASAERSN
jgi:hypothetical protein